MAEKTDKPTSSVTITLPREVAQALADVPGYVELGPDRTPQPGDTEWERRVKQGATQIREALEK